MPHTSTLLDQARPLFETPPPAVTAAEAALIARQDYGLAGNAKPLSGERDANFLIQADSAVPCVLKFINDAEPDDEADMQACALEHLADTAGPLAVPRAIAVLDGRRILHTATASGRPVRVRCYSYLPGESVLKHGVDDAMRRSVGRTAARLAQALSGFRHPAAERLNLWDLCKVGHLSRLLDHIAPSPLADAVTAFLQRFQAGVVPRLPDLRRQVIHNDLSPSNLIVGGGGGAGGLLHVVDFGDMIAAPLLSELAVAASYQLSGDDPMRALWVVVAGFCEITPLEPLEYGLLLDFVMARLVDRLLITRWRAQLFPENRDYILRSSREAQALLLMLFPVWQASGEIDWQAFFNREVE